MDRTLLQIQELYDIGWIFGFSDKGAHFMLGDTNCPHSKEFDPKDGHGFSEVVVKIGDFWSLDDLIDEAYPQCKAIVPGAKK